MYPLTRLTVLPEARGTHVEQLDNGKGQAHDHPPTALVNASIVEMDWDLFRSEKKRESRGSVDMIVATWPRLLMFHHFSAREQSRIRSSTSEYILGV